MDFSSEDSSKTYPAGTKGPSRLENAVSLALPEPDAMMFFHDGTNSYMKREELPGLSNSGMVAPDAEDDLSAIYALYDLGDLDAQSGQDALDCPYGSTQVPEISSDQGDVEKETTGDEHRTEEAGARKDILLTPEFLLLSNFVSAIEHPTPVIFAEFLLLSNLTSAIEYISPYKTTPLFPRLPGDPCDDFPAGTVRDEVFSFKISKHAFTALSVPIPIAEANKPTRPGWQWRLLTYFLVIVGVWYCIILGVKKVYHALDKIEKRRLAQIRFPSSG